MIHYTWHLIHLSIQKVIYTSCTCIQYKNYTHPYPPTHVLTNITTFMYMCVQLYMYMYYFLSLFLAKVRRLYDIANILTSLGLITKKVFIGPHHIKKPGYAWSGPTIPDIDAVCKYKYTCTRTCIFVHVHVYVHVY